MDEEPKEETEKPRDYRKGNKTRLRLSARRKKTGGHYRYGYRGLLKKKLAASKDLAVVSSSSQLSENIIVQESRCGDEILPKVTKTEQSTVTIEMTPIDKQNGSSRQEIDDTSNNMSIDSNNDEKLVTKEVFRSEEHEKKDVETDPLSLPISGKVKRKLKKCPVQPIEITGPRESKMVAKLRVNSTLVREKPPKKPVVIKKPKEDVPIKSVKKQRKEKPEGSVVKEKKSKGQKSEVQKTEGQKSEVQKLEGTSSAMEDEFEVFGRTIALQLKQLPPITALRLKDKIQQDINQEQLRVFGERPTENSIPPLPLENASSTEEPSPSLMSNIIPFILNVSNKPSPSAPVQSPPVQASPAQRPPQNITHPLQFRLNQQMSTIKHNRPPLKFVVSNPLTLAKNPPSSFPHIGQPSSSGHRPPPKTTNVDSNPFALTKSPPFPYPRLVHPSSLGARPPPNITNDPLALTKSPPFPYPRLIHPTSSGPKPFQNITNVVSDPLALSEDPLNPIYPTDPLATIKSEDAEQDEASQDVLVLSIKEELPDGTLKVTEAEIK